MPIYRFFVRRLFLGVGATEKLADVRSAGIIGATLVVVLTLTLPVGVSVVLVRMRKGSLRIRFRVFRRAYPQRSGSKRQGTDGGRSPAMGPGEVGVKKSRAGLLVGGGRGDLASPV